MNCPVCNEPLLITNRQGVEIDHCPKCKGVWLDRGELDKIIERSSMLENEVLQPEPPHITTTPRLPTPPHIDNHHEDDHGNADGPDYRSGHNDNYGYNKHANTSDRKKGFLGDLFDF